MIYEPLWYVTVSALTVYAVGGGGIPYMMEKIVLPCKSTEKIRSLENWKDAPKLTKVFYVLCPGAYLARMQEKKKRK
jgi:hypothetical protein